MRLLTPPHPGERAQRILLRAVAVCPLQGRSSPSPEVRKAGWEGWEQVCQTSSREGA